MYAFSPLGPAASLAASRAAGPNLRGVLTHDFVTELNAYCAILRLIPAR